MKILHIFVLLILLWVSNTYAATEEYPVDSGNWYPGSYESQSLAIADVQDAVDAASDTETVHLKSGAETWATGLAWSNKNIALIGAGIGNTVITGTDTITISVTASTSPASFRISGMTLISTAITNDIAINSSGSATAIKGWRIDNVYFNSTSSRQIYILGMSWGLIDNCQFDHGAGYCISLYGYRSSGETIPGDTYWALDQNLGTDEAVYIEDSTFNITDDNAALCDIWYGGALVVRYCDINFSDTGHSSCGNLQTHDARTVARGGKKLEAYENTIDCEEGAGVPFFIRSGSGVIYNNSINGFSAGNDFKLQNARSCVSKNTLCDGDDATHDGNDEANGWPCMDQIGRGSGVLTAQVSSPLYMWKNGTESTCVGGGTCDNESIGDPDPECANELDHISTTGDLHDSDIADYYNNGDTPMPGYTSYTYPHPLSGGPITATGTLITAGGTKESDIRTGTGLIATLTLHDTTFVETFGADNEITTTFIAGVDGSDEEGTGWDGVVKAGLTHAAITRDSATQCTIDFSVNDFSTFDITANTTVTITIPATSTAAETPIVATPTFLITAETTSTARTIEGMSITGCTIQ